MKKMVPCIAGVFLLAGAMAFTDRQKSPPLPSDQKPPVNQRHCPDYNVVSFKIELVSTQAGNPAIEFPHDKVKLTLILENAGNIPIPDGYLPDFTLKRNDELILNGSLINGIRAPGSREELKLGTDSFLHGVKTTYYLQITTGFRECRTDNNKISLTIDENLLHRNRTMTQIR